MDKDRAVEVTAIGCSVTMNLGGDRQIVLQSHFASDMGVADQNGVIDRLLLLGDRQKARYDLEREEDQFREVGENLIKILDGIPFAEANYKRQMAALNVELMTKREAKDQEYKEGYDEFLARGGKGAYAPKGHRQAALNRMDNDIAAVEEKIKAAPNDRAQHRQELIKSVLHYQGDLKRRRAKINALRETAGLAACDLYQEQEAFEVKDLPE